MVDNYIKLLPPVVSEAKKYRFDRKLIEYKTGQFNNQTSHGTSYSHLFQKWKIL